MFTQDRDSMYKSRLLVWLSLFTAEGKIPIELMASKITSIGDPAAIQGLIRGRPISRMLLTDGTHTLVSQWIHECVNSHPACGPGHDKPLPTRVIDVGSRVPKLITAGGRIGRWVALSHCWGGNIAESTTTKNLGARLSKLVTRDLPKNFQDAISITRWLGYRYLWIDSLCILQDSKTD